MREKDLAELTDAALDGEISRATAVDPSPAFVPRLRQRLAGDRVPRAWTLPPTAWLALGAAVAAAALFVVAGRRMEPAIPAAPPLEAHAIAAPRVLVAAPDVRASVDVEGGTAPVVRQAPHRITARGEPGEARPASAAPVILIDPREARALRSLIDGVATHRRDVTALLAAAFAPGTHDEPVGSIEIAPIEVSPLTGEAKGVSQ
jgi:hypothetical protein